MKQNCIELAVDDPADIIKSIYHAPSVCILHSVYVLYG